MTSRLTELRALLAKHERATHWYDRDFANQVLMGSISALIDVAEAAGVLYHDGLLANRCGCEPEPADKLCRWCELAFAYEALTRADDKNNQQEKSP